jgi:hypothetical protein
VNISLKNSLLVPALTKQDEKDLRDALALATIITGLSPIDKAVTTAASNSVSGLTELLSLCVKKPTTDSTPASN